MTPTDAQIEAAARTIFEHMTDIDGDEADWLYFREMLVDGAKAALTAAAEVGAGELPASRHLTTTLVNDTIERCAQVLSKLLVEFEDELTEQQRKLIVDQLRRALKDKPAVSDAFGGPFPEEEP